MKLVKQLLMCWLAGWLLMLVSLAVAGSIFERKELLEITNGSGLTVYLLWVGILSSVVVVRYFQANFSK